MPFAKLLRHGQTDRPFVALEKGRGIYLYSHEKLGQDKDGAAPDLYGYIKKTMS